MRNLLFIIFLLIGSSIFAQEYTLVGKCLDKKGDEIPGVLIFDYKNQIPLDTSDNNGLFQLKVQLDDSLYLSCLLDSMEIRRELKVTLSSLRMKTRIVFPFEVISEVRIVGVQTDPFELPHMSPVDYIKIPMGNVERALVYMTAASSNNELTSNYNVRGGSYNENLVYVNGFNIYRPLSTRSGQQEGMSFVNSALVQDVQFSAGGFDSRYGDKLASVLDITYRKPEKFKGTVVGSLLGVEAHLEDRLSPRMTYLFGARYRANGYLLNSLPAKGAYNPIYWDAQGVFTFDVNENVEWSTIAHFSSNQYRFAPQTSETKFGTFQEAYKFKIYFDGNEDTRYTTMFGGTSVKWKVSKRTKLDFYATAFHSDENERFDIQGQYFINKLEMDPSKEAYGDSIAVLGIGTFLNHARNSLNATVFNLYHNGEHILYKGVKDTTTRNFQKHKLMWGWNYQYDLFDDQISEWKVLDSAGYNLPHISYGPLELNEVIKNTSRVEGSRINGFLQMNSTWSKLHRNSIVELEASVKDSAGVKHKVIYRDTVAQSYSRFALNFGLRSGYTDINHDFYITPRASLTYYPRKYMIEDGRIVRRNIHYRLATGLYYQPPFYREYRDYQGDVNLNVLSQKSVHIVGGTDIYFNMWNREAPFKFTSEIYYKYLWDVNIYELENVRTRYYANNDAVAYAYGIDLNVNGQFVQGIESYFKIGFLHTMEDLKYDSYYDYYNEAGEKIIFGYSQDQKVVDSTQIFPGYIPRPTDQWVNVGALIQDQMPNYESISVQLGMQFGSSLPYGPIGTDHYKDTLRQKYYFRVDVGMSYDLLYKKKDNFKWVRKYFTDATLSFEVFNLLGIDNILSNQWIQDVNGKYYSIPNYLTQRRFNLKAVLRF
jgi:hypothetical protein